MAGKSPKSQSVGHVLPLALEARLAAHCVAWNEPAADVVADAVELLLDGLGDQVEESAPRVEPLDDAVMVVAAALAGAAS